MVTVVRAAPVIELPAESAGHPRPAVGSAGQRARAALLRLHGNDAGYQALADSVDLSLFG